MTKQTDDEIVALKARVAELEQRTAPKPADKPFKPTPYQRHDPTAGMCMPRSALQAMAAAVPDAMLRDTQQVKVAIQRIPALVGSSLCL
jgi:hypothetical protein